MWRYSLTLDLSSLLERPHSSANGGGPADGMRDSHLQNPPLIHHQVLEQPQVEFVVPVALVREVYPLTRSGPADHHRHHSLELE